MIANWKSHLNELDKRIYAENEGNYGGKNITLFVINNSHPACDGQTDRQTDRKKRILADKRIIIKTTSTGS